VSGFSDQGRKFRELSPPLQSVPACVSNSIRIFGVRTGTGDLGRNVSARKADCRVRRLETVGLCCAGGQIFSEFRHRHCGIIVGFRRRLVALGGLFTTWHFIVVISSQQRCAKDGKGRTAREGFARDKGGPPRSSAKLQRQRRGWTTMRHPFPPKLFWAEFWAEIWRFIR
jgi:hypothetical protein